jgi:5-methylcytosine-specific restriction enzyme subunit McrC
MVGAVRIGDLDVLVRPKMDIRRLLFLLGYAADPGFRDDDASGMAAPDLWPTLAASLARQAERALARGLLHGYHTVDEALPLVRGRIRVADQIATRPGQLIPLEVRYDEYVTDIPENRLLRTAARRMAAVPRLDPQLRARLTHLDSRLDGVQLLTGRIPPPAWRASRLNAHYTPALRLAEIVLRHQSVEPGPNGSPMAGFVVSMAKVFEDFLTTALREALARYPGHTQAQHHAHLDQQRTIAIRPDIVHTVAGRPVVVFDAKYKLESPNTGFPGADAYQMLAYCTALLVRTGWLVYAHGTTPPGPHRVRHTSIDIIHYPLDLSAPPAALLQQVATLAEAAYTASTGHGPRQTSGTGR